MPDPLVVTQANAFRAALLRRESAQLRTMTAHWARVERTLERGISETLDLIALQERRGNRRFGRNQGSYLQLERYRDLLRQTRAELNKFADYAANNIQQGVFDFARDGANHAAVQVATVAREAGVFGGFNRLSVPTVENIAGVLQADAPVGDLLRRSFPEAAVRMTDALIEGTALGWNPRRTAAAMARSLSDTILQRTMVIARTEQLRAYRTATQEGYRQSGVVIGYKRLAAKSSRTCIACLLADGQFYGLDESFSEHPNGRCTLVPVLQGIPASEWTTGRTWFEAQPAAVQRDILGRGGYNAWQDGAVSLDDLVKRHEHPVWGASLGKRALRDAVGVEAAKAYSGSAFYEGNE